MLNATAESNVVMDACSLIIRDELESYQVRGFLAADGGWASWIAAANTPNGILHKPSAGQIRGPCYSKVLVRCLECAIRTSFY